jgi:ATP-dependent RNA helicase DHX36
VDPRIGKMMIFGSVFRCLEPVLTIAASMSFRSPFVSPIDKRDEADRSKRLFAQNLFSTQHATRHDTTRACRCLTLLPAGDHLALWVAFKGYEEARREGRDRQFCHAKFLSQSTLRMIADLKSQFFTLLVDIGFVDKDKGKRSTEKSPGT